MQLKHEVFTVAVKLDAKLFRRFALFDTFRRQRRWVSPALFAGIMLAFSLICYMLRGRNEQAVLLGTVLLGAGLLLPAAYFLSFFLSVRASIKNLGLAQARHTYTVTLSAGGGVRVSTETEQAVCSWQNLYGAYRVPGCVYLYAAPTRAYLLPDGQIPGGAARLWRLLETVLPAQKLHDLTAGRA